MKLLYKITLAASLLGLSSNAFARGHIWLFGGATTFGNELTMGSYTVSNSTTADIPGIGASIPIVTAGSIRETMDPKPLYKNYGLHAVLPFGIGVGANRSSYKYTTQYKTTTAVVTALQSAGIPIMELATSGDLLASKAFDLTAYWVDVSYTLPLQKLIINIGGGMPVSSTTKATMTYSAIGQTLLSGLSKTVVADSETLTVKGDSAYAVFANFGYSIKRFDILAGVRSDYIKGHVDLTTSPLQTVVGSNKITSESRINTVTIGLGLKL